MIWRLLSNCWYLVLINGQNCEFFSSNRGLRHGGPLSPYLFIIATELFSRSLTKLHETYNSLRYRSTNDALPISHLAYADDDVISCNDTSQSLKKHMNFFQKFHNFAGLKIN